MKKKTYLNKPRAMTVAEDTPESLQGTDIAHRAIDVANAAIEGTGADSAWDIPTDPEQARIALTKYKAAVAALNAANGIVKTKMSLFKLMDITGKAKKLRERGKKL